MSSTTVRRIEYAALDPLHTTSLFLSLSLFFLGRVRERAVAARSSAEREQDEQLVSRLHAPSSDQSRPPLFFPTRRGASESGVFLSSEDEAAKESVLHMRGESDHVATAHPRLARDVDVLPDREVAEKLESEAGSSTESFSDRNSATKGPGHEVSTGWLQGTFVHAPLRVRCRPHRESLRAIHVNEPAELCLEKTRLTRALSAM